MVENHLFGIGIIDRVRFFWARFGGEPILPEHSASAADLRAAMNGKTVAIVGNSRALANSEYGVQIDSADLVIRINRAPMPSQNSHGCKTTWLALATSISRDAVDVIGPKRILWLSHKRKRLPFWVAKQPGFYLHPIAEFETLKASLGAPPTTGMMMIELASASQAASIDLYGFDFFASRSLTGSRTAAQVPHDFPVEQERVMALIDGDPRVKLHR